MGDKEEVHPTFTVKQTQDWVGDWDEGNIGFHMECINPMLEKHADKMIAGRKNMKIFIPLSGKALDMKWLADKGHTVVGVEAAQLAIEDFFTEQGVAYTSEPAPACNGTLFQSEDKRLQLYCCDIYNFSTEVAGQFDGIWDRGSLVAINREDRARYTALVKSLMAPACRCLLSTLIYDETRFAGPPHYVSDEQVQELYGDTCCVEKVDAEDILDERFVKNWRLDSLYEHAHLITLK